MVVLCGGNIDTTVLGRCLERGLAADGRLARFTVRLKDRAGSVANLTKFLYEQNARLELGNAESDSLANFIKFGPNLMLFSMLF